MFPIALGYLGFSASDLDDWRNYGSKLLGLQPVDKTAKTLGFRMDERRQRFCIEADGKQGVKYFGWEVADAGALQAIAKRIEAAGVAVAPGSRALADERHVEDLIVFADPMGHRVEIFHGPEAAKDTFHAGRTLSGFRTGSLGLGHIVMTCERIDEIAPFYENVLGFGLSDWYAHPFTARFLHLNERHHSLAFVQTGQAGIHHLMIETLMFDDVGQALDIANAEQGRVAVTLGRHAGDCMTSFYTWTPSGFMCEYGWGGESIDPDNWTPFERTQGPSLWGHERSWLTPERQLAARAMRMRNAENGVRRPVQVLDGNYNRMRGACPWWDGVKSETPASRAS
jgi:2,3-dihydroxybiphenyl 1,2-dioxygenase